MNIISVECPSPLAVVQTRKSINPNLGKPSFPVVVQRKINLNSGKKLNAEAKPVKPKINLSSKKPLIVKTYDNVSAPAPLFGPFKSKIPLATSATRQDGKIQIVDLATKTEWTPQESSMDFDPFNDIEWNSMGASEIYESVTHDVTNIEDPSVAMKSAGGADKAIQTECFCQCYNRGNSSNSGTQHILQEIQKISSELKEFKLNVTGKTATKLMDGIFPIKSEANLMKIQYNMEFFSKLC